MYFYPLTWGTLIYSYTLILLTTNPLQFNPKYCRVMQK